MTLPILANYQFRDGGDEADDETIVLDPCAWPHELRRINWTLLPYKDARLTLSVASGTIRKVRAFGVTRCDTDASTSYISWHNGRPQIDAWLAWRNWLWSDSTDIRIWCVAPNSSTDVLTAASAGLYNSYSPYSILNTGTIAAQSYVCNPGPFGCIAPQCSASLTTPVDITLTDDGQVTIPE